MAVFLDTSVPEYITSASPVSTFPFTISAWALPLSTHNGAIFWLGNTGEDSFVAIRFNTSATLTINAVLGGSISSVATVNTYTVGQWVHAIGRFRGATDRDAVLAGDIANMVTINTNRALPTLNGLSLGRLNDITPASALNGHLAEAACWNVSLSDTEVISLSRGLSPALIRPDNLVFYAPLVRPRYDAVGSLTLTDVGTPDVSAHPRIFYPVKDQIAFGQIPSGSDIMPPTTFQATTGAELGEIVISWTAVSGAIAYHLYRADTEAGEYELIAETTELTWLDNELQSSTTFWYKIASEAPEGVGPFSAPISASTIAVLSAPANFTAATGTYFGQIDLAWDAVAGAAFYRIYRSTESGIGFIVVATSTSTTYTDAGLQGPRTYYYTASAVDNASTEGPLATEDSATTLAPGAAAPPAPTNLTAVAGSTQGQAVLRWQSSGADVFAWHIYQSTNPTSGFAQIAEIGPAAGETDNLTYTVSGLGVSTAYYWRVTSDNLIESAVSNTASLIPGEPFPAAPTNIVAVTGEFEGYIDVSWTAVIGATGYNVYRSLESEGPYVLVAQTILPRFFDAGLEHDTTYYYRVAGVQA